MALAYAIDRQRAWILHGTMLCAQRHVVMIVSLLGMGLILTSCMGVPRVAPVQIEGLSKELVLQVINHLHLLHDNPLADETVYVFINIDRFTREDFRFLSARNVHGLKVTTTDYLNTAGWWHYVYPMHRLARQRGVVLRFYAVEPIEDGVIVSLIIHIARMAAESASFTFSRTQSEDGQVDWQLLEHESVTVI